MSHTNSTANYNLPQFVGTDKPAWLGDINPAMSAIDTAIKNASDSASTADGKATTAQSDVATLGNTVTALQGTVNTQGTQITTNTTNINTANNNIVNLTNDVTSLQKLLVMNNFTTGNINGTNLEGINVTLAQNTDGSVFKIYGNIHGTNVSIPRRLIPGTSKYGIPTGCVLITPPSEAYQITCAGFDFTQNQSYALRGFMYPMHMVVGTDGEIYLWPSNTNSPVTSASGDRLSIWLPCSIYFNTNFGDVE